MALLVFRKPCSERMDNLTTVYHGTGYRGSRGTGEGKDFLKTRQGCVWRPSQDSGDGMSPLALWSTSGSGVLTHLFLCINSPKNLVLGRAHSMILEFFSNTHSPDHG